jgi:P-type Ca2+ transporter type 2C
MDQSTQVVIENPWAKSAEQVMESLGVDPAGGLSREEVAQRRKKYGHNRLREAERRSTWEILAEQFKSLIVGLLVVAAILSFVFQKFVEGIAVVAVIVINAMIGFITELRAVRSMEALQELGQVQATVYRAGELHQVPAEQLVPGDIVELDSGDVVTADLRLIEANKLQADESALTGESTPVSKNLDPLDGDVPLAERKNMVFKGTAITRGSGRGVVVSTGMDTELGQISSLVEEAQQEVAPLEKRLDQLGKKLVYVTLAIAVVVAVAGILVGRDLFLIIETSIALAIATVPEGLPIVATIALARGMRRMAKRNALVNRLSAVETLGGTNVICTDKTGTLTENLMTVVRIEIAGSKIEVRGRGRTTEGDFETDENEITPQENEILDRILRVAVLCNNASIQPNKNHEGDGNPNEEGGNEIVGEPLEIALLVAGKKAGLEREQLVEQMPEAREVAFDPETKMMATFNSNEKRDYTVAVKGAAEAVLANCTQILTQEGEKAFDEDERQRWLERDDELAAEGLRVLALATRRTSSADVDPYDDLIFLGLVAVIDPPREEVRPSLEACQKAGVRVIMVTGDHPATARKVALAVGLVKDEQADVIRGEELSSPENLGQAARKQILESSILARVSPEQKLDLIAIHQDAGAVVAMTGDGVNDAPALKKADIGVAMGERGTQVAKEAADMILQDDAFSSIVLAIEQGRVIFDNIRKFVYYLLSCNLSEIMVVTIASVIDVPLPIRPLQILFLNLVTDVFPALALGVGEGQAEIMEQPPRDPDEPVLTRQHWFGIGAYGTLITGVVLAAFWLAFKWLGEDTVGAVTLSFLTLAFAQLWHVFNMRNDYTGILNNEVVKNPWVWLAVLVSGGMLLAALYVPFLADLIDVVPPSGQGWLLVMVASLVPLVIGQVIKVFKS